MTIANILVNIKDLTDAMIFVHGVNAGIWYPKTGDALNDDEFILVTALEFKAHGDVAVDCKINYVVPTRKIKEKVFTAMTQVISIVQSDRRVATWLAEKMASMGYAGHGYKAAFAQLLGVDGANLSRFLAGTKVPGDEITEKIRQKLCKSDAEFREFLYMRHQDSVEYGI